VAPGQLGVDGRLVTDRRVQCLAARYLCPDSSRWERIPLFGGMRGTPLTLFVGGFLDFVKQVDLDYPFAPPLFAKHAARE